MENNSISVGGFVGVSCSCTTVSELVLKRRLSLWLVLAELMLLVLVAGVSSFASLLVDRNECLGQEHCQYSDLMGFSY